MERRNPNSRKSIDAVTSFGIGVIVTLVMVALVMLLMPKSDFNGTYSAELLMPGNTVVMGDCDGMQRISGGWAKFHINGKWYAAQEWRVVLQDDKRD